MKITRSKNMNCKGNSENLTFWVIVLVLLLTLSAGGFWYNMYTGDRRAAFAKEERKKRSVRRAETKAKLSRTKTKAQSADAAKTEDVIVSETILPWLKKNWKVSGLAVADTIGIPTAKWKPFAESVIQREINGPNAPGYGAIAELADALVAEAGANPYAAYLVGRSLSGDHEEKKRLLADAYLGFTKIPGAEILAYHAAVEWVMAPNLDEEDPSRRASNIQKPGILPVNSKSNHHFALVALEDEDPIELCMGALKKALQSNNGFSDFNDRLAGYLLVGGIREGFFEQVHKPVHEELANSDSAKLWFKKWIEGRHFQRVAWEARGGGYSNSVSDNGWALFSRNMLKAKKSFEAAWAENPQHAGVAASMIARAQAEKGSVAKRQMNQWFDEMSKIQVDYADGFSSMLWGLRPRWYGSHRDMISFGERCLKSERFDSAAPWWYLQAHRDVASEWDLPSNYFPKLRSFRKMDQMFEGFENEPKRKPWRQHDRTQAVVTYFQARKYNDAKKWLDLLGDDPLHEEVLASWGVNAEWMMGKTEAFTGDFGKELQKAEQNELRFRTHDALETYLSVLEKAGSGFPAPARRFLEHRKAVTQVENDLNTKSSVANFIPGKSGVGWAVTNVTSNASSNAAVFSGKTAQVFAATCESRIGPQFTMEGKLTIKNPAPGARLWVSFGYPEKHPERWGAVSFLWQKDQAGVQLSNAFNQPEEDDLVPLGDSCRFKLSVSTNGISLWIDDKQIWDNVPVPRKFVKEPHSKVGFGAILAAPETEVTLSDVKLSK